MPISTNWLPTTQGLTCSLVDAALAGKAKRALRMLDSLRREDAPLPVVAWAITKEVRTIAQLRETMDRGGNLQPIFRQAGVWDARKNLLQRAMRRLPAAQWRELLQHCARLDQMSKGQAGGDPWQLAAGLCLVIATGSAAGTELNHIIAAAALN